MNNSGAKTANGVQGFDNDWEVFHGAAAHAAFFWFTDGDESRLQAFVLEEVFGIR